MSSSLPRRARGARRGRAGLAGLVLLGLVVGAPGCAGSDDLVRAPDPHPSASVSAPLAPAPLPSGRLPATARPLRYEVALVLDPERDRFTGDVTIGLAIPAPTQAIVLHGRDLTISRAEVVAGGVTIAATPTFRAAVGGRDLPEELVLTLARPLLAGQAELRIAYSAPINDKLSGLYRVREGGRSYAFTQFEPNEARRMIPCFDEPSFKVSFELKVTTPKDNLVVANAEEVERRPSDDGHRVTFRFAPTAPLPTYLFALAVGPLEVREGPSSPVKIRLITTRGKSGSGALAIEAAAALTEQLARYFDRPFPYPKLDLVSVPEFGFGAMENAGLIAFREELILLDEATAATSARRLLATNVAHEVTHHWLGNLVTMPWWDDLWLNEGFATLLESRMVDAWRPSMALGLDAFRARTVVMERDALDTARAMRRPVTTTSEAEEAFDEITYDKGAAVFGMLESWLGPEVFRAGIRAYLAEHAHGNATAVDLFRALSAASGKDVGPVASSFLDQPGLPLVRAELVCDAGAPPKVRLTQSRYRPMRAGPGRAPSEGAGPLWKIPSCLTFEGNRASPICRLLDAPSAEVTLPEGRCPRWFHPNAEEGGYYRFALPPAPTKALFAAARTLDPRSRTGLIDNAWALVQSGDLGVDALLDLLASFKGERHRMVVEQVIATLDAVSRGLIDEAARPAFRRFVSSLLLPLGKELGWEPRKGEGDEQRLLRKSVLGALATLAEDPWLAAEADKRAAITLREPRRLDPDLVAIALQVSARRGGEKRFDELLDAARHTTWAADRVVLVSALGSMSEPVLLRRALDTMLSDQIKLSDSFYVFNGAMSWASSRPIVLAWVKEHLGELKARMPDFLVSRLSAAAASICDPAARDDAARVFGEGLRGTEGAERSLAQALETADVCIDLRRREGAAITRRFGVKKGR